jgi:hypothetical protein
MGRYPWTAKQNYLRPLLKLSSELSRNFYCSGYPWNDGVGRREWRHPTLMYEMLTRLSLVLAEPLHLIGPYFLAVPRRSMFRNVVTRFTPL